MMKSLAILIFTAMLLSCSSWSTCFASEKTYVLFIAPSKFTTQEFLEIATKNFSDNYIISKKLQDYWTQYCWNMNLEENDQKTNKEILSDFISKSNLDKIVFVIFKDAKLDVIDQGGVFVYGMYIKSHIGRSHIQSRVIVMNHEGETLKIFEEESENISGYNERRANRGAFRILCKNISKRLNLK